MNTNFNQDFPLQTSLNFFSINNASSQNLQKSYRSFDPTQVKAPIEGSLETQPNQPQVQAYNTQQSNPHGNHQYSQKQMMNHQYYQNQAPNQNFNSTSISKNQSQYNNRQNKGQNFSNNTQSGNNNNSNTNGNNTTTMRAGDWICLICNNLNFSFRNECNRCKIQTKQQNYIQNMMIYQQEKLNSSIHHQQGIAAPQLINYDLLHQQHQQQQQQINQQMYHRLQQQQMLKSNSLVQPQQSQQFLQPFIPLLNMNLKRANSEKENKEPQPGFNSMNVSQGSQIGMNNLKGGNHNTQLNSQNQDVHNSKVAFNNNLNKSSNQGGNLNTPFQINQSLQRDCINLNTPQLFYPKNNQNLNELKISQYQEQQQLYNSSQNLKQNDLNNLQNFQYNFNQLSNQTQQQQQHYQFENQNFQQHFQVNPSMPQPPQLEHAHKIDNNQINQQEIQKQRQMQFIIYQQQQQPFLHLQQNSNTPQNLIQIPHIINHPQISSQYQLLEKQSHYNYPYQQNINNKNNNQSQQYKIQTNELQGKQDDQSQIYMQNYFIHQQAGHSQQQLQSQQNENEHIEAQGIQVKEKQFEYQQNTNEQTQKKQSTKSSQQQEQYLKQQNFYFPHQINFLQFSQQEQIQLIKNSNVIQNPLFFFQQQQQFQQFNSNQQTSQGVNSNFLNQVIQTKNSLSSTQQEQNTEIANKGSQETSNNSTDTQNSLNMWPGPKKGYENMLLVTPPKTKQFQQQNLPLSDIEILITQFKLMYSTEKKSQTKSLNSDKSESHSNFFGSNQKEIQSLSQNLNFQEYQDELVENQNEISVKSKIDQIDFQQPLSNQNVQKQIQFSEENDEEKIQIQIQEIEILQSSISNFQLFQKSPQKQKQQEQQLNSQNPQKNDQKFLKIEEKQEKQETTSNSVKKEKQLKLQLNFSRQENCTNYENNNQSDQNNTDVSQISTQILTKQINNEKYQFLEEIRENEFKQDKDEQGTSSTEQSQKVIS